MSRSYAGVEIAWTKTQSSKRESPVKLGLVILLSLYSLTISEFEFVALRGI